MKPIKDIQELKELAKKGCECFILLNYGLRSSKNIKWNEEEGKFWIHHEIDDTEEFLTEQELFDESITLIGKALKRGCLIAYPS